MNWKVTLHNENLSKITVWVDADTNDQAQENAFNHPDVKDFVKDYDGLLTVTILTEEQAAKIELFQTPTVYPKLKIKQGKTLMEEIS